MIVASSNGNLAKRGHNRWRVAVVVALVVVVVASRFETWWVASAPVVVATLQFKRKRRCRAARIVVHVAHMRWNWRVVTSVVPVPHVWRQRSVSSTDHVAHVRRHRRRRRSLSSQWTPAAAAGGMEAPASSATIAWGRQWSRGRREVRWCVVSSAFAIPRQGSRRWRQTTASVEPLSLLAGNLSDRAIAMVARRQRTGVL